MKKKLFLFSPMLLCLIVNAQEKETFKEKAQAVIADKFPAARVFDVQYRQYSPSDFSSELYDHDFQSGEIKNHYRISAAANIPVIAKPKWSITASVNYRYEAFELQDVQTVPEFQYATTDNKPDFHYLAGALSFTYFSQLFKKPFIYNASVIADGTEKDVERIKGFVGATLLLKANRSTKIGVGLLVFIDPTSQVPLAPIVLIEHHFKNSPWMLDFILPQRLLVKRPLGNNGKLSIGSEMNADGFYTYPKTAGFAEVYDYRRLELLSGVTYEHYLGSNIAATFKAGMSNLLDSKLSERGERTTNETWSSKQDASGYFSLGFSFNPMLKSKPKPVTATATEPNATPVNP